MTRKQLLHIADDAGIPIRPSATKQEIINEIKDFERHSKNMKKILDDRADTVFADLCDVILGPPKPPANE